MKKYYNSTTQEWYIEGQSMTKVIENGVYSGIPTEEMLLEWGFEEWVEPTPTPEQLLEKAKADKIVELKAYDSNEAVNSFTINGQQMWLTVEERQLLATQINANESIGRDTMTRWFNGVEYTFPLTTWKQMLIALEVYAGDAINVTESHKATINALTSVEDVNEYDFTVGYPNKVEF